VALSGGGCELSDATCGRWRGWESGTSCLVRESEILHFEILGCGFEMLKKSGAIQLASSGKDGWVAGLCLGKRKKNQ